MSPHSFRLAAIALLVGLASCSGPSSPLDPDPRTPDPIPPGQGPDLDPRITVSASALSLGFVLAEASVELRNLGSDPIAWSHAKSARWFTASPGTGTLPGGGSTTVRVVVDRTGLAPGFHAGLLQFVVGNESIEVEVSVEVQAGEPMAEVSPDALALGPDDAGASIEVTNTGDAPLHWSWSGPAWVQLDPVSGTTSPGGTTLVTATPDRDGLTDGTHLTTLTLDSDGGPRTVALSVAVASPPRLFVSPGQVNFGSSGSSSTVALANRGGRPLDWTASVDASWLALGASAGTLAPGGDAALALSADRGGLTPGTYFATLSVDSDGGSATVTASVSVPVPEPPPDPDPDPPPPPPPPPPGSTALAGRVIDQFDGHGVAGLTVQFAGTTVTTDGSGSFTVPGPASGSLRVLGLSGPGVYTRSTFARSSDAEWRVVPSSFDMAAFDDMAREYEPRTIRWVASPSVYVDVRPDAFAGGPELDQWVAEVQGQAAAFVSQWTGGTVSAGSVQVGSSPPPDGLPGTIVIHFSEDGSIYGAPSTVGLARTFWTGDRSISSAILWLRFVRFSGPANATIRSAVLGHELGHALGLGHMEGSTASIMTPSVSSNSLTSFDQDAGFFLYTRSPGNTSPDVDDAVTYRGSLALARAAGVYEWVCGADDLR